MTNEQKRRIWELCEGTNYSTARPLAKKGIGWPENPQKAKNDNWGEHLVPHNEAGHNYFWHAYSEEFAQDYFIRWLEDRLIEAGYSIERDKSGTSVANEQNDEIVFKTNHLDALLNAAETEGVLK